MQGSDPKALNPINLTHLMLTNQTQRITAQLYHERMLDCTHSLHDLTHDLRPLHHKQLSTSLKCCPGLVVQSAETRLRDMQTLVQQEAGVLLDRQRITIEGTPTPNPCLVLHCRGLHALQCVSMLPSFHGWLNFSNGWCFCIADNGHDPESGV